MHTFATAELEALIADLRDTMAALDGAGLAAPQIGVPLRVVQHECDHLDGVLYPDRIEDHRAFGFTAELEAAGLVPPLPPE